MRFTEIQGGFNVPVSGEEMALMTTAEDSLLRIEELDERQTEVARKMVSRGILRQFEIKGAQYVGPNKDPNLWRF